MKTEIKKGFTIIEVALVIVILSILIVLVSPNFTFFQKKSALNNTAEEIITTLRFAQSKTLASEGPSQYGVYFDNVNAPNQYILFKGDSYATRDISFDQIRKISKFVEISNINLGSIPQVVFNRLSGEASSDGDLTLRLISNPSETKTIYTESSGLVSLRSQISPIGGRLVDSRHVHFNLGWSIQNATSLKFYFPNTSQTEMVDMTSYFNGDKTNFDWEGTFNVAGTDQSIRAHTHSLDSLCIHRDRNNGKNNQELIVYIVDGLVDKEIAHYLADANDTVLKGSSCDGDLEVQ